MNAVTRIDDEGWWIAERSELIREGKEALSLSEPFAAVAISGVDVGPDAADGRDVGLSGLLAETGGVGLTVK